MANILYSDTLLFIAWAAQHEIRHIVANEHVTAAATSINSKFDGFMNISVNHSTADNIIKTIVILKIREILVISGIHRFLSELYLQCIYYNLKTNPYP